MNFPKIYILIEPFNDTTGMGVTLTNLFKDWPQDKIAIAAERLNVDLCKQIRPCHSYLALSKPSINTVITKNRSGFLYKIKHNIRTICKEIYTKLGTSDLKRRDISCELKKSILEFKPDIIFTALGSLDRIRFANDVINFYPKAKLAVYIVDDWPNTKQNGRWLPKIWQKIYDFNLRGLLNRSTYLLSICQAMSDEYKLQYSKEFIPFHNPVDVEKWDAILPVRRYPSEVFSIVYVGKINRDTKDNILNLAEAISALNEQGHRIKFDVYSPSSSDIDTNKYNGFEIKPSIPNSEIPQLLKSYDVLYLTLGFSKISRAYTRLSMPTKITEYLVSGVPILINAPKEIAVTKYIEQTDSGLICENGTIDGLKEAIQTLCNDKNICERITMNAHQLAQNHDIKIVRKKFKNIFTK